MSNVLRALRLEAARRWLLDFTLWTFPGYKATWHLRLLCEYLDAWITGLVPRLIVLLPPRYGKSELVSRRLPAYLAGRFPGAQIIAASYGQDIINSMSRAARAIVASPEYQELFPGVAISAEKGSVEEWETTTGAVYKCAGVGGGITGRGFDFGIIDDPVKDRAEAESQRIRQAVGEWYGSTFYTRRSPDARILVTQTRWHEDDLTGRLLRLSEEGGGADRWEVLRLPALAEAEDAHPRDRRKPGEALWPQQFSAEEVARIRTNIGPYDYMALYQQRPKRRGGEHIQRHWFAVVDSAPEGLCWVRFWDLAVSKDRRADYTASCAMAVDGAMNLYVRDMIRGHWRWPEARTLMKTVGLFEGTLVGVEEAGQQKGFIDDLLTDPGLAGVAITGVRPTADKLTRALPWIARAAAGQMFLVKGSWINDFLDECEHFTGLGDAHDDQVDAVSGAYTMLAGGQPRIDLV